MKKFFGYLFVLIAGSAGVYYALLKYNEKTTENKDNKQEKIVTKTPEEKIPSKDDFLNEAIKLQTLAENTNGSETCKCYNVKDLDYNTTLTGSILVYTVGDLFVSNLWVSNGYYMLNNTENVSSVEIIETKDSASLYCGEKNKNSKPSLCESEGA